VLAGREPEQSVLNTALHRLCETQSGGCVILSGPRGNGKTALLKWLVNRAKAQKVGHLWLTPDDVASQRDLARLVNPSRIKQGLSAIGLAGRHESVEGSMRIEFEPDSHTAPVFEALHRRVKNRPCVLIVDEAHALDSLVGQALLNSTQKCLVREAPLLLVLAGTPDIQHALDSMNSSFWSRSRILGIGLIENEAVLEAIERPLADQGIALQDDAVRSEVIAEAQGYPYFAQLLGDALWESARRDQDAHAPSGSNHILGSADATYAFSVMSRHRQEFYETRLAELYDRALFDSARAVLDCFADQSSIHREQVDHVLEKTRGSAEQGAQALVQLQRLGFIWSPPGSNLRFEPGIPSFFSFLREYGYSSAPATAS